MNKLFSSIKSKIIFMMIMIVGLSFLAFGTYDYQQTATSNLVELNELADIKSERLAENLSLALWEIDKDWAQSILNAEMADKRVAGAYIYDAGVLFIAHNRDKDWHINTVNTELTDTHIIRSKDILHNGNKLGSISLHITQDFMEKSLKQKLVRNSLSLGALALLIILIMIIFLNKIIVQRLEEILVSTQSSAAGNYSQKIDIAYQDEIGLLGTGINTMNQQIQKREYDLKESENRFRSLVNNAADSFFLIDANDASINDVNIVACKRLGYSKEQLLKMCLPDIQNTQGYKTLPPIFSSLNTGDTKTLIGEHLRADGTSFPVEVTISIIEQSSQKYAIALARDITERLQAETKNSMLSQALEQSGEAIVITDNQGAVEYINSTFTIITGYSETEILGKNNRILQSGKQSPAYHKEMWESIIAGKTWTNKIINKKKDGTLYPAMLTISPIKDDKGAVISFIATQQDLEDYEDLEAKFHQAQKMEAIGTLVGGIAHDFNNTLAGIVGNLYLAKKDAKDTPDVIKRLETVEKLSFGASSIIQQLLAFSRKGPIEMLPISISSFLKETIKLQQVSLSEAIALNVEIHDTDMQIKGDLNQLQQVLMNLINNAVDALTNIEKPLLTITLNKFHPDQDFIDRNDKPEIESYACITVSDNGAGISDEHLGHIFEPFFTTKEPGKGTGLGLAMSFGAIATHNGIINVETKQGDNSGTSIHVYLPLLKELQAIAPTDNHMQVIQGQGETILLVDDNQTVLETGKDVLKGLGYHVITAYDGVDAIDLYTTHQTTIDLLILDVVMPRLGGPEALHAIKDINPDVKALFATGYDRTSTLGAEKGNIKEKVISKPFAIAKLSQAIRETLEKE